jgi:predicted nucleic acid-binding protein
MFILDTNVVSELRKARDGKADPRFVQWVRTVVAVELFLSVITVMELEIGVLQMERRDPVQGDILRKWLDRHVIPEFLGRTLPVDFDVAGRCARLHVPNRRNERDAMIAATAIVHGMTVVTRNVIDFETTGALVLNPWNAVA